MKQIQRFTFKAASFKEERQRYLQILSDVRQRVACGLECTKVQRIKRRVQKDMPLMNQIQRFTFKAASKSKPLQSEKGHKRKTQEQKSEEKARRQNGLPLCHKSQTETNYAKDRDRPTPTKDPSQKRPKQNPKRGTRRTDDTRPQLPRQAG